MKTPFSINDLFRRSALMLVVLTSIWVLKVTTPGSYEQGTWRSGSDNKIVLNSYLKLSHPEIKGTGHKWFRHIAKDLRSLFKLVPKDKHTSKPLAPEDCQLVIQSNWGWAFGPYTSISTKNCQENTVSYTNPTIVADTYNEIQSQADFLERSRKLYNLIFMLLYCLSFFPFFIISICKIQDFTDQLKEDRP